MSVNLETDKYVKVPKPFKENEKENIMKAEKGKAKIKNATGKMGIKKLADKKPKGAMKPMKGKAKVANGRTGKGIKALASKQTGKTSTKTKFEVAHAKRAVKLANYKF